LKVGQASLQLSSLMMGRQVDSAAFITAFNPYSSIARAQENALNHKALLADLSSLGIESIGGEGRDSENLWPSETSILALGISLQNAELLARRYKQNAFLWISGNDGLVDLNLMFPVATQIDINQKPSLIKLGVEGSH